MAFLSLRGFRRWIRGLLIIAACFLLHMGYVAWDGLHPYHGAADLAVVLGNAVDSNGVLSPWLKGRVDRALLLYRDGAVPRIMVSGGKGETFGHYPEGLAMKQYLVAHGVPADRIIEDNEGANTYLTAKDLLRVADSLHPRSVIVVSSFYHVTRAKYIIRKLGFSNVYSVSSQAYFWNDLAGWPRDCVAFYKYLIVY
jgi:uncharacterized SAM-binding protein YcdF (DUF218 family)